MYRIPLNNEFDFSKTVLMKHKESHAFQIDLDRYVLCEPPFLYVNHSCQPNCGIHSNFELLALTEIQKGDELFWDYSTSMLERHWTMKCECREINCRHIVTDFDLLPENIQTKYLENNIVLPYIVQYLQQQLSKTG